MDTNKSLLTISAVTKEFSVQASLFGHRGSPVVALDRFSLAIDAGEIFGLVGESGSGKTTVSRLIVGLEKPDSGEIHYDGQRIVGLSGRTRKAFTKKVQIIFQDPYQSLNAHLSIFDTVCEPLIVHGVKGRAHRKERVVQALETAGLTPPTIYLGRYPHQLSGGQRQRVSIARAMVLSPRFLIADEPTSMLDATISFQIFQLLRRLRSTAGVTMLFITHSLSAARNLCDRVGVIYRGRLVEVGSAAQTIMDPLHPYTKALLDAHPRYGSNHRQPYDTLREIERPVPGADHCPFYPRCQLAMQHTCNQREPVLKRLDNGRWVSCFLFNE